MILLASCATIQAPNGGEKDVTAPKIEAFSVPNTATQFSGNELNFSFDEYIVLNNPQQNVLISPPLDKTPTYTVKGKNLSIRWDDTLKANTTYNFYFAKAIKDNNEGNDTSFSWVFSTGNTIDSLSLQASALNAETGEPMKNIWLLGYLDHDLETVLERKPDFIAQTNDKGVGKFQFLPDRNMTVFALEDNNGNLRYDRGSDKIGFIDAPIEIKSASTLELDVFSEPDTALRVLDKKYIHPGYIQFVLNQKVNIGEFWGDTSMSFKSDTAGYYLLDANVVKGNVSTDYYMNGQKQTATFYINDDLKPDTFKPTLVAGSTMDHEQNIVVTCPRPIDSFDETGISLWLDSLQVPAQIRVGSGRNHDKLIIEADLKPASSYTLKMDDKAIQCFYQLSSDSVEYVIKTREADFYGQLKVSGDFEGKVVQLLKEGKVVREIIQADQMWLIKKLTPGKYRLRMIDDTDGNGEWSTGKVKQGLQPEKVYYYPEIIDLRSGWDQELVWEFK